MAALTVMPEASMINNKAVFILADDIWLVWRVKFKEITL
jgi:hypothetical protein